MRRFRLLLEIADGRNIDTPDEVVRVEMVESLKKKEGEIGFLCQESVLVAHSMGTALQMATKHLCPDGETADDIVGMFRDGYVG